MMEEGGGAGGCLNPCFPIPAVVRNFKARLGQQINAGREGSVDVY